MAAYWSRLSPVPAFPDYTGPYAVGSVDVELPVAALASPSPAPAEAAGLGTVQFRVFYPADAAAAAAAPRVRWLPAPPRQYVSAYAQFLGAGTRVADLVSFLPRHLHYTTLPAGVDAAMAPGDVGGDGGDGAAPGARRWPAMVFSHGLGGSRNAYAHLAASVASHGVVVVCPEHRDGSAVLSFVRDPNGGREGGAATAPPTAIPFRRMPHTETPDAWAARAAQLRIRLWELGLVHDALLRLDGGEALRNLAADPTDPAAGGAAVLAQFAGRLDVHRPGAIAWAGHSFGAASVVQLLKTTFYGEGASLYEAAPGSALRAQITAASPTILLDVWCFPLLSPATRGLLERPLPAWAAAAGGASGAPALLAVASESFVRWTEHLHTTARLLSPDPRATAAADAFVSPDLFYVARSAHLSQSDFGLVFPWLTRAVFKAPEPARALRLNVRAILQLLRRNGVAVARTAAAALVEGAAADDEKKAKDGTDNDTAILDRRGGAVADWVWVDVAGLVGEVGETTSKASEASEASEADGKTVDTEASMEGELEPHMAA